MFTALRSRAWMVRTPVKPVAAPLRCCRSSSFPALNITRRWLTTNRPLRTAAGGAAADATVPDVAIYYSSSTDPFFNLGTEQFLFDSGGRLPVAGAPPFSQRNEPAAPPKQTLFLWRNEPSVIIGCFQNPWKECFVDRLQSDSVHLVRRRSGGGAVFQDLGNSIFTFITTPKSRFNKDRNTQIVLDALRSGFGVTAESSGRNDMTVDGKKISGSAFKHSGSASLHHGTLLLDVEMSRLGNYLNPNKAKLASKGITSVIARVTNLKPLVPTITHRAVCDAIAASFLQTYGVTGAAARGIPITELSPTTPALAASAEHKACVDSLKEWEWRFGKTPEFTYHMETRFDWGIMDCHFDVENARIRAVKIFSDALYAPLIESLTKHLSAGIKYTPADIRAAIANTKTEMAVVAPPAVPFCDDFERWLISQL